MCYTYIYIFIFIYLYMHTALMLWHLSNRLRYMRWGSGHWVLNLVGPPVGNVSENSVRTPGPMSSVPVS